MRWEEAVQVAIYFGWLDSTVKKMDKGRRKQVFSPRKDKSVWSKRNKTPVEKLIKENQKIVLPSKTIKTSALLIEKVNLLA